MGKGKSPESKEYYERQARRSNHIEFLKELGSKQATLEDEWVSSFSNEAKKINEQKRLARNARARARRAEKKANDDNDE